MKFCSLIVKIRKKPALAIGAFCVALLVIGAAIYLCLPMPAGTSVGGLDVSGQPWWRAWTEVKSLQPQPLRVALPEEMLTIDPEEYGVHFRASGALSAARKQGGEISLRPYLKADEKAIREKLTEYAEKNDTRYRETAWHLEGTAPDLKTDCFDAAAGQTLVVELGLPEAHLDVETVLDGILDALSQPVLRNGDLLEFSVEPEKVPETLDVKEVCRKVNLEPVDDAPDFATCGIKPGSYGQEIDEKQLKTVVSEAKYGETIRIPLTYTPPEVLGEDALYQDVLGEYETKHNTNENRNNNLRLLCQALDGHIIQPGETFSYNQVVGERTAERGYLPAPAYSGKRLTNAIGGGVCQGSTTLYNCVLLADLEVVFRACHGAKVTYVPPGLDASVNWLTTDFQFRNQYRFPVKIRAEVSDGYVKMKLLGTDEKDYYVVMETRSGDDDLAVYARSYKCKYDKTTNELRSREIEAYSTYYKNIG